MDLLSMLRGFRSDTESQEHCDDTRLTRVRQLQDTRYRPHMADNRLLNARVFSILCPSTHCYEQVYGRIRAHEPFRTLTAVTISLKKSNTTSHDVSGSAYVALCGNLSKLRLGETHTPTYTGLEPEPARASRLELGTLEGKDAGIEVAH